MPEDLSVLLKQVTDIGAAHGAVKTVDGGVPFLIVPNNYQKISLVDQIYNDHQANPQRKKGEIEVDEPESFLFYLVSAGRGNYLFEFYPLHSIRDSNFEGHLPHAGLHVYL